MKTIRLESFSDGVLSIVITIMVLTLTVPEVNDFSGLEALVPKFLSYLVSFIYLGIFWTNHHHIMRITKSVNGRTLWANLNLLFWLSLIPFSTTWVGESDLSRDALVLYGAILLLCSLSFMVLVNCIKKNHSRDSAIYTLTDRNKKALFSIIGFSLGIGLSYISILFPVIAYVANAFIWFMPNTKIEEILDDVE